MSLILGIETSCDDTSVAIVDAGGTIISACTASQASLHDAYGGIYPEVASRAHVDKIIPTVHEVMQSSGVRAADLVAVAATRGPGLIGSLLVGTNTAAALGRGWELPVIGVNHLRGHLRSADLEQARVRYPAMVLLVSGGHTLLARMEGAGDIKLIGSTLDDSVGETYDKVARMLGLGYPGGPVVDRLAKTAAATVRFPRPLLNVGLDFSFSGLKTAVSYYLADHPDAPAADVAASFVDACMTVLVAKCRRALAEYPSACLVVVGGVAASPQLREQAQELCDGLGVELCLPPLKWSTDNGAMIALASFEYLAADLRPDMEPVPRLTIENY